MPSTSRRPIIVNAWFLMWTPNGAHPSRLQRESRGVHRVARRLCLAVLAATVACVDRAVAPIVPSALANRTSENSTYDGSYIVRLAANVPDIQVRARALIRDNSGVEGHIWGRRVRGFSVHNITPGRAERLRESEGVLSVEPLRRMRVNGSQSLPNHGSGSQFAKLWALDRIDHGGGYAYDTTFNYTNIGDGVHLYIIDSGVRGGHNEFSGRIGAGTCIVSYYILGIFQYHISCSETNDWVGHGTAVASAAAGTTYGVAKSATIHPVRVVNDGGEAAEDDVIDGLEWVAANASFPAVVNISIGKADSTDAGSFAFRDAIDDVLDQGILVFKSAGNFNQDAWDDRSNRASRAVIVGATEWSDTRANFSNYGSTVTLMSPGTAMFLANSGSNADTAYWAGTSFASPLAAGVAATLLEGYPGMSRADLKNWLLSNSSSVTITNGNSVANLLLFSNMSMPSPPPPPLTATILGSSAVPLNNASCFFSSTVYGGSGGYTYVWKKDGSIVGTDSPDLYVSTGTSDFTLELTVSASGYTNGFDTKSVTVSGGAPGSACDVF